MTSFGEYRERWELLPAHVVAEMAFTTPPAEQAAMWAALRERVEAERELDEVADRLLSEPWPPPPRPARAPRARTTPSTGTFGPAEDPVRSIPAEVYVERLTGQEVGPNRKILCPLHSERTASFHVYPDGWFCFGCHRGGDVYALASGLWQLALRGRSFLELRRRLAAQLLLGGPDA